VAEQSGLLLLAHEHIAPDSAFSCCYLAARASARELA
jgi:hypothetical protein